MKKIIGLLIMCCILYSCSDNHVNKFSDPVLIRIADLQDRRQSDSLYAFLKDKNQTYRKEAALAFASVQDTLAVEKLKDVLLSDTDKEVRRAAAMALGQTPSKGAEVTLLEALKSEKDVSVLRELLESCGKTFSKSEMSVFAVTSADSLVQEGLAWAYYRAGLRNQTDSTITVKAIKFLAAGYGLKTRIAAANFFARGAQQVVLAEEELIVSALQDVSPWIRATSTTALRKIKTPKAREAVVQVLKGDSDYRVRISAVRALQAYPFAETKSYLFEALKDEDINVAIAASEVILAIAPQAEVKELAERANSTANGRIRGNLYQASLAGSDNAELVAKIIELYKKEKTPYSKAALLTALGESKDSWKFLDQELQQSTVPIIKTTAASALVAVNTNPSFDPSLTKQFAQIYINAIGTGDPAVIGIAADALQNPKLGYKQIITDFGFLYEAKKKLSLPKDNESLQPLEAALAYFEEKETVDPVKNQFNHPIDWALVKTIPKNQKVLIKTDKGDIVIRLLVEEAPGSVANFVQLINAKYFDSKNFHRVVPNFVIQGGCNRGDGSGSEDYSIRSEFTEQYYTEGSVGMASAGKDTEGTQWFITHSPTPHLDGRYSIFAITESGMDTVHRIEVGDKIISASLLK